MLETALLTVHASHLTTPAERRLAWDCVTEQAARILEIPHGIEPGRPATFNVFPPAVESRHDALRLGHRPRWVVHDGSVVATTEFESTVHR